MAQIFTNLGVLGGLEGSCWVLGVSWGGLERGSRGVLGDFGGSRGVLWEMSGIYVDGLLRKPGTYAHIHISLKQIYVFKVCETKLGVF